MEAAAGVTVVESLGEIGLTTRKVLEEA